VKQLIDIFVIVLAWQVSDLQAAAIVVPLAADRQHVGYIATGCQLCTTYCIFLLTLGQQRLHSSTPVAKYSIATAIIIIIIITEFLVRLLH